MIDYLGLRTVSTELISPLSVEDCIQRLRASVDVGWTGFGKRLVLGRLGKSSFEGSKRIGYRNSFQTQVTASFVAEGRRTRIRCRFGMHPFVLAFLAIWMSGVATIGGSIFVASVRAAMAGEAPLTTDPAQYMGFVVPPAMLVFGVVLIGFGRWLARGEQEFLTEFLCTTLQAQPLDADGSRRIPSGVRPRTRAPS